MRAEPEIGYIMKGFPRLSETFIANEIHLLEAMGMRLRLYSVKGGDKDKVHGVVSRIRAPISYLPPMTPLSGCGLLPWLWRNVPQCAAAHGRVLRRHPVRYLRTLASALKMCWRYRSGKLAPRKVFVKEFLQAGQIAADVMDAGSISHLHGHFCHGATTITWFVSRLTGLPFSFTAHAKDIYLADLNPGDLLARKLAAARFVTTCTAANERYLAEHFPAGGHVHTVYHGLDTDYFAPVPGRSDGALPMILSVGRFVEKKGFTYLVRACAALKARGLRFRCLLVGEPGEDFARVCGLIEQLDVTDVVQTRTAVVQEELRSIYAEATVFALPCQVLEDGDRDGIPNVLAEAMAMAIPIVSTNISGIPELVEHERDGLLVPQRDADSLAAALAALLEDDDLRTRLGRAGRNRVCQVFDSRETTHQLRRLFLQSMSVTGAAA